MFGTKVSLPTFSISLFLKRIDIKDVPACSEAKGLSLGFVFIYFLRDLPLESGNDILCYTSKTVIRKWLQGTRAKPVGNFVEVVVLWFSPSLHSLTMYQVGGTLVIKSGYTGNCSCSQESYLPSTEFYPLSWWNRLFVCLGSWRGWSCPPLSHSITCFGHLFYILLMIFCKDELPKKRFSYCWSL